MRIFNIFGLCIACTLTLLSCSQQSESPLQIDTAWIREAPPGATAMAGYMQIINNSANNVILHSANSPAFKAIEFHRSIEENGVYKMVPHLHLHIAANSTFELKPGDYHLMMFNPTSALKEGDTIEVNLVFSNEHIVSTSVPVKKAQY
ncbi:MAG: copper chaperone PCu(A)C [Gammaproteobacteria bacterium]|nr:copper chaperone PCu(A)C [Gammaproteobacteria bacterium]